MAFELKTLRRQYGLSQSNLAEILNVNQATVSRWERGLEHLSKQRQNELVDVFINKNGRLDKLFDGIIRCHPRVSIFDAEFRLLFISAQFANELRINPSDVIGMNYNQLADASWCDVIHGGLPLAERLMVEYVHDFLGKGALKKWSTIGMYTKEFWLELEGCPRSSIALVDIIRGTNDEPRLVRQVGMLDLDSSGS